MTGLQRIGVVIIGAAYVAQVALTLSSLLTGRGLPSTFFLNLFSLVLPTGFIGGEIRRRGPADAPERARRWRAALAFGIGIVAAVIVPLVQFTLLGADGGDPNAVTVAIGLPVAISATLLTLSQLGAPPAPASPAQPRSSKRRR